VGKRLVSSTIILVAGLSFISLAGQTQTKEQSEPKSRQNIIREVRHQLILLPYYSVFDDLSFRVDGATVTLQGQVVRPTLKSDAEGVIKNVEGVVRVVNNIELLPSSPMDDQIRRAEYRAIFSEPGLSRYAESAVPSIHIIVQNGNVTLVGTTDNDGDKNLANIRANGVPNVFGVRNDLVVASSK
jgi:hyperosmotically inducible periplasmic protein